MSLIGILRKSAISSVDVIADVGASTSERGRFEFGVPIAPQSW